VRLICPSGSLLALFHVDHFFPPSSISSSSGVRGFVARDASMSFDVHKDDWMIGRKLAI